MDHKLGGLGVLDHLATSPDVGHEGHFVKFGVRTIAVQGRELDLLLRGLVIDVLDVLAREDHLGSLDGVVQPEPCPLDHFATKTARTISSRSYFLLISVVEEADEADEEVR